MKKAVIGAVVCLSSIVGVGASAAFAGEVTGQGRGTPLNAGAGPAERVGKAIVEPSHCAFSGLEDNDGAGVTPGVVQTPAGVPGFVVAAECGGPANGNVAKPAP
jgi:hypothetical protein